MYKEIFVKSKVMFTNRVNEDVWETRTDFIDMVEGKKTSDLVDELENLYLFKMNYEGFELISVNLV